MHRNQFSTNIIKHELLSEDDLEGIVNIKEKSWPYGKASQLKWLQQNINPDDLHLIIKNTEGQIQAYANLVNRNALRNTSEPLHFLAIGNVCADVKGLGLGSKLMSAINQYLEVNAIPGILLCQSSLCPFYEKQSWQEVSTAQIAFDFENDASVHVFVYNFPISGTDFIKVSGASF